MKLVWGYLGYDNYGDELLANIVSNYLQKQGSEVNFLSSKQSIWQHFKLLTKADSLIAVGGLFQDRSSIFSVLYYALIILLAKICRLEIILLSQGIGPLNSMLGKTLTVFAFSLADKVSVRDEESSAFLQQHNIDYKLLPDLAWTHSPQDSDNIMRTNIIFAFRQEDLDLLDISKIKKILLAYPPEKYSIAYVNMQPQDVIANKIISQRLQLDYKTIVADPNKIFASSVILLGTRLHALILAQINGARIYNPKDLVFVDDKSYYQSSFGQKTTSLFYWLNNYSVKDLSAKAADQLKLLPLTL